MVRTINIEDLQVDFYKVDSGYIFFKLAVGTQRFKGSFSEVWDPLLDFRHWLEAIAIGVQQTSFHFDPEGTSINFNLNRIACDNDVLIISELCAAPGQFFIKASVDRKQIVRAFYRGLLDFAKSDAFDHGEWEIETLADRLGKMLHLEYQALLGYLSGLRRVELVQLLDRADPPYDGVPDTTGYVSADYDGWAEAPKRAYLKNLLNAGIGSYRGMKISGFQSQIVEQYLEDE